MRIRRFAIGLDVDASASSSLGSHHRVALDWSHESGFTARCVELPGIAASAPTADATVDAVEQDVAAHLARPGEHPAPLDESEGPLGAWAEDLELMPFPPSDARMHQDLDESQVLELHRIARCTAARYRVILGRTAEGFVAWSPQIPDYVTRGPTASSVIGALRPRLAQSALRMLAYGLMPPEPLQDAEQRRASAKAA